MTINDQIVALRNELNKSIEKAESYEVIYNLSIKLDKLITLFYKTTNLK
ncbi:aspartyl-phosphate phosphatase Spo0E family protein [Thermohalobacter berrensis]|nr:aspartyl-phosphate phosphatase Spo0E family protein [Thermohalobacter berrensis]